MFLNENNRNYNSCSLSYKFAFMLFLPFLTNQKQESGFHGLATGNNYVFCLYRVAFYLKAMPNSIDFYEIIPVRIIVPWY